MNDFTIEIQSDDLMYGDDFLQWVAQCEWEESQKDDVDRRWDDIRGQIESEWVDNQPMPW
jgi:hypothetical protein